MALVITLKGTKAKQCFDFSVIGNANADIITFKLTESLDSVHTLADLSELDAYIKLQSVDKTYIDKCIATKEYVSGQNPYLNVSIILKKKSTHYSNLYIQLQFEDDGGNVVSQSGVFALVLSNHIPADEEISDEYPYAIQELESIVLTYNGRISDLEHNAVKVSDIVDNVESEATDKPLSANQGRVLNEKINNAVANIYSPQGSASVSELNELEVDFEMNGYVYDMSDSGTLNHGSVQVNEGDNVAIIFDKSDETHTTWKWDRLSGIIDLSNYPTKTGDNTFTGTNTQKDNPLKFARTGVGGNTEWGFEIDQYARLNLFRIYNGTKTVYWAFDGGVIVAGNNQYQEIGNRTRHIGKFYVDLINPNVNGYGLTFPDTTNNTENKEIATTDIVGFKVIDAPSSTTLTNDEVSAITNGAIIKGSFLGATDLVFYPATINAGVYHGELHYKIANRPYITQYFINQSNVISINTSQYQKLINLEQIEKINGTDFSKILNGIYDVINASDVVNNTFNADQMAIITNGKPTLIVGDLFFSSITFTNIFIHSLKELYGSYYGTFASCGASSNLYEGGIYISSSGQPQIIGITIPKVAKLNDKSIEYYLNNVYPYATNSTTELKYETINDISISADTTFTLATAPTNTYPEYKANITNSGASAITITMPANTIIKTNDDAITISSNTFTLPASATVELNYQNGTCIVFNWAVSN